MLDLKALLAKILNCLTCDLLYSGSFTSGTLTLTNAIANYKSLIFVYQDNDGVLHTQQVITNNTSGGDFILDVVRVTGAPYLKNMVININGKVLTCNFNRQWAGTTPTTGNYVIINKVYGCKGIVSNGGGYLTSKLYEIFSHLERWCGYVRFKGVVGENIECISWVNSVFNLLSNREHQSNIEHRRWNKWDKTSRRSLCCIFLTWFQNKYNERYSDSSIQIRFSGWVHLANCEPVLLSLHNEWSNWLLIRQLGRLLVGYKPTVEREHRVQGFWSRDIQQNKYSYITIPERGCLAC